MRMNFRIMLGVAAIAMVAGANAQDTRFWEWNKGDDQQGTGAGEVQFIRSSFNTVTNRLTWSVNFAATGSGAKANGFHLVMSPGDNPKGHAGELAILYFDASTLNAPQLTAYNYNGFNGASSFQDGSPQNGVQAPDKIKSSVLSTDWINSLSATNNNDGTRTLSFDIDATAINNHTPLYPGNSPWTGARYGEKIGIWFHGYTGLQTSYGTDGFLSSLSRQGEGWVDLNDKSTSPVPEPASMAALGLGVAAMIRRRKSAKKS